MAEKKSTKDILAALRAETAKKSAETPAESQPAGAGSSAGEEAPAAKAPAAKSGAAPKSTKDIMAALRKETAGGGAKPTAKADGPKPAAKKAAAKRVPVEAGGEKPSVQEMLKAAREGKPLEETPAKPVPKKPVAAGAIRAAKNKAAQEDQDRRVFLLAWLYSPFIAAWVLFSTASGAFLLGMARFMMPNVLVEPPSIFKVGGPGEFSAGTVSTKYKAEYGVWIVNTLYQGNQLIFALRSVCTHLGCTPSWLEGEQKFKCPCHGSGFYIDGINFEGPAPRPLERVGIALAPDGLLEEDQSLTFQHEMGQWADPASCYKVG
jgi:cytochrome b6-f complex iron-sulfur subunit